MFKTIVADPPWLEQGGGKIKRGADRHYPLMRTSEILLTMGRVLGVSPGLGYRLDGSIIEADCHLWLWVTDKFLHDGLEVMEKLGFRYVRTMAWGKVTKAGVPATGLGQYMRGAHELCLFGVRGSFMKPAKAPPSLILAPRGRHSEKPQAAFDAIERVSPSPRLEMFARAHRPGWSAWGNEAPQSASRVAEPSP